MTIDQIILFTLFGAVFGMLLWGRFRYDLVAFAALMIGVVLGVVPTKCLPRMRSAVSVIQPLWW